MSSELWTGVGDAIELWAALTVENKLRSSFYAQTYELGRRAQAIYNDILCTYVEPRRWLSVMHLQPAPGSLMTTVVSAMTDMSGKALKINDEELAELHRAIEPVSVSPSLYQDVYETTWESTARWGVAIREGGDFVAPAASSYGSHRGFEFLGAWLHRRVIDKLMTPGEAVEIADRFDARGEFRPQWDQRRSISLASTAKSGVGLGDIWRELASCIAGAAGSDAADTQYLMQAGLGKDISDDAGRAFLDVARAWYGSRADAQRVGSLSDWTLLVLRLADYRSHHRHFARDGELVASTVKLLRQRLLDEKMSAEDVFAVGSDLSRRWSYRQLFEETRLLRREGRRPVRDGSVPRRRGRAPVR